MEETRAFFAELLRDDLPARNLVASDFAMLNERLAAHYGLPGVEGAAIRRVALPTDSRARRPADPGQRAEGDRQRHHDLARAARRLDHGAHPRPARRRRRPRVPAVEPDTRGATTIREQLGETPHAGDLQRLPRARSIPPGFALENFDVIGGWRDRYRALGDGRAGRRASARTASRSPSMRRSRSIPSGVLPDGRNFSDVRELKRLLLQDERQIARNLVRQLVIYATGAPVRFGDRPKVEAILDRAQPERIRRANP